MDNTNKDNSFQNQHGSRKDWSISDSEWVSVCEGVFMCVSVDGHLLMLEIWAGGSYAAGDVSHHLMLLRRFFS